MSMKRQSMIASVTAAALGLILAVSTIAPMTVQAADNTTVYITNTGNRYHLQNCRTLSGKSSQGITTAQARAQGLTACRVCNPDDYYASTVTPTTTTTAAATTTTAVTATAATSVAAASITPADAVQQAYALYVQNGLDSNTAFARVQALTAQLVTQPANYAQIVQNDLASLQSQTTVTATGLTAQDAVQRAFALYVQSGLDTNSAFARVQMIVAQLAAQPDNYAQIVQNDLVGLTGQTTATTNVTATSGSGSNWDAYQAQKQADYAQYQAEKEASYQANRNKSYAERRADYERVWQENQQQREKTYNQYH